MSRPRGDKGPKEAAGRLDPEEEKVIRMRRGLAAPRDLELEFVGREFPETLARLQEIERMAFTASGRIDELRREAAIETDAPPSAKQKIVSRLAAEVSAVAKTTSKKKKR